MRFPPRMTDAEALMWQAERDPSDTETGPEQRGCKAGELRCQPSAERQLGVGPDAGSRLEPAAHQKERALLLKEYSGDPVAQREIADGTKRKRQAP